MDFEGSEINGDFEFSGFHFKSQSNFRNIKVGGTASFRGGRRSTRGGVVVLPLVFPGPVDFEGAEITGDFVVDRAKFESTKAKLTRIDFP